MEEPRKDITSRLRFVWPLGRIFLALIFLASGLSKIPGWDQTVGFMATKGIPLPHFLAFVSIVLEIGCGLAILLGLRSRLAAGLLFLYLIPVTLTLHDFWNYTGPGAQLQIINFMKNLAIMGGLLILTGSGSGAVSLDERRERKLSQETPVRPRPEEIPKKSA